MEQRLPRPITVGDFHRRSRRVRRIARRMGFAGRVSYRHVYNSSGGGQYERGTRIESDHLTISAEAFDRDADSDEYSLEAIIAHECGHQIYYRHPKIRMIFLARSTRALEEVAASIIGSLLVESARDQRDLMYKACLETCEMGIPYAEAWRTCREYRRFLEELLCSEPHR